MELFRRTLPLALLTQPQIRACSHVLPSFFVMVSMFGSTVILEIFVILVFAVVFTTVAHAMGSTSKFRTFDYLEPDRHF